ncbi:MAG: glucose-6-phosphate isomerase [Proteobacteria bacterium]|nr:glucose-6-phosphate isomerase [Pseudomonadota bacterium]
MVQDPTQLPEWENLLALSRGSSSSNIADLFDTNPDRVKGYSVSCGGLYLDYSKNLVSDEVKNTLLALASASKLESRIKAMFQGERINITEDRAVLHTALRSREKSPIEENGVSIGDAIERQRNLLQIFSERVRAGDWKGSTGKTIRTIVNIGIGGSDLGPKFVCQALEEFAHPEMGFHFISNVDGACIRSLLNRLDPETTLFIVQSKSFTTQETLLNTSAAIRWCEENLGLEQAQASTHFVAVTANRAEAEAFGIQSAQIFEFWDWVGGRYSLWSSIGLPIALMVGYPRFMELLNGAATMDDHFRSAPFEANMPVIMALLGIWYSNFLGADSVAVIPYCERLGLLPSYLQQLDMESNGKSVSLEGKQLSYTTGPIVWGQTGTNGQHAFFQLLHQGTRLIPVDFIATVRDDLSSPAQHRVLLGNMLAQSAALMLGHPEVGAPPHQAYPGNRPSNTILMGRLMPTNLGALIALYEHKVFVQGVIWNINSFDQWGVELGKKMAKELLGGESGSNTKFDASTRHLLDLIEGHSGK